MASQNSEAILVAVLGYVRRGWPVLPIHLAKDGRCSCGRVACSSIGKHPRTPHGLKDAARDEAQMWKWWTCWPDANVGIITGIHSGLVVLDIDPRNGGEESLEALERKHGALPPTVVSRTGGGGQHIFFQHPGTPIKSGSLVAGVDVKADGGYVVASPSTHASGQPYEWNSGAGPENMAIACLPHWLWDSNGGRCGLSSPRPVAEFRHISKFGLGEGERNIWATRLAGHLLRKGVDPVVTLDLIVAWNQVRNHPPLPRDEVIRTVDGIAGRELRRRQGR